MTSGDIKKIRSAKLVLLNGLGLEAADVQRAVKQSKVPFAEATKGIQALKAEEGGHHHDHDHEAIITITASLTRTFGPTPS